MQFAEPDVLVSLGSSLGEGPRWDHRLGELAWVDILGGLVHRTDPSTGDTSSIDVGDMVGALALLDEAAYLLALGRGFAELRGGEVSNRVDIVDEGFRLNDAVVDPRGRFLAGSVEDGHPPTGTVYSREPDGSVRSLFGGASVSNGIGWSADGTRMYYADSAVGVEVFDYDLETGDVANRRLFVEIPESDGVSDGLVVDADDCVWVAIWGAGAVRRFSPDGRVLGEVRVPALRSTAAAFGGPGLGTLFITSATAGATPETAHELDGALFAVDVGVTGVRSTVIMSPA
jgi:sugar lactone lactonase YvrE